MFIAVVGLQIRNDFPSTQKIGEIGWQESFDLTTIPNGLVIWKHGVIGSEIPFIHADTTVRYKYFDIGILTNDKKVHRVRLPYYIMGTVRLGFPTNYREKEKKNPNSRNPKHNSYVYPYDNQSFLEKNKNS